MTGEREREDVQPSPAQGPGQAATQSHQPPHPLPAPAPVGLLSLCLGLQQVSHQRQAALPLQVPGREVPAVPRHLPGLQ